MFTTIIVSIFPLFFDHCSISQVLVVNPAWTDFAASPHFWCLLCIFSLSFLLTSLLFLFVSFSLVLDAAFFLFLFDIFWNQMKKYFGSSFQKTSKLLFHNMMDGFFCIGFWFWCLHFLNRHFFSFLILTGDFLGGLRQFLDHRYLPLFINNHYLFLCFLSCS